MAIEINNGLPLQKYFIAVQACLRSSSESLQRTKVLIDTFTPYQIGEKSTIFLKKWHLLEEFNMPDKDKERDRCMCKFECTNITPKRRNRAHFKTHVRHTAHE